MDINVLFMFLSILNVLVAWGVLSILLSNPQYNGNKAIKLKTKQ